MKSHRRCVFQVKQKCKWTTRSSLEQANVKMGQDVSRMTYNLVPRPIGVFPLPQIGLGTRLRMTVAAN